MKVIATNRLSGRIFMGNANADKTKFIGHKRDVTDEVIQAAADHLSIECKDYVFKQKDGKYLILTHEIVDKLPEDTVLDEWQPV
ncbi:DUF7446 family protein [Rosenbergiella epipactidis]|uniref:DUF7446 family protein n=1 Tax=Rosenbergiella epipactidis TaxID=1544694 RepID=UPI001F4F6D5C|nr:hypothetical protein [Rosenbergiella epipactidis]